MKNTREKVPVIDTDIHNNLPSPESLHPYLSERWRKHQAMIGGRGHAGSNYPRGMPHAARYDAWPSSPLGLHRVQILLLCRNNCSTLGTLSTGF